MKYKEDTGQTSEMIDCYARIGKMGDVILDADGLDEKFIMNVRDNCCIEIPDPDYVNWLEEKVMELLK
jgi:hypothetical protein